MTATLTIRLSDEAIRILERWACDDRRSIDDEAALVLEAILGTRDDPSMRVRVGTRSASKATIERRGGQRFALTAEIRREIQARNAAGERQVDLAREFGIDQGTVSRLVNGLSRRSNRGEATP